MSTSPARTRTPCTYDREIDIAPERDALVRALAQSEERFQRLVERIAVGVFRASADGRLLEANPALVRMLGYSGEGDLVGREMHRELFADPIDCDRLRAQLQRSPVERAPARWTRKDGTTISIRLSVRLVEENATGAVWCDGIVEDVTERVRQQEQVRRTERMACLGATLAGVAHELNNPLAAILGFAQLLLKSEADAEARHALETIDHEAGRAGKIVRDLLTLARKRESTRRMRVSLNEVITYIVGTRRYALETHGISCTTTLDSRLPLVIGERTQLEQVVLNLLNNAEQAVRSTKEIGGRIHIRTRAQGTMAVFEIDDNGPGIPPDERERIWDPFWTTKSIVGGTGLGLTVVRDIISSHGGEISAEDANDDLSGARFAIRLPGECCHGLSGDVLPATAHRALDVLVVDSDAQSVSFVTTFLASRGHAALAAHEFEHATQLANHLTFDAVICDAGVANGGADLGELRAAAGCAEARFIVSAGEPETTARLPVPLPGAMSLVLRPYDLEELRVLLED
jgi:PAS domain S-box-containing protein